VRIENPEVKIVFPKIEIAHGIYLGDSHSRKYL